MYSRGRDKAKKFSIVFSLFSSTLRLLPYSVRTFLYNLFRNTNGLLGIGLRYILLRSLADIGTNVAIFPSVFITKFNKLKIGDNVSIQPMSYIDGYGGVRIGNNVSIAHHVTIMSTEHNYHDLNIPIKDQGFYESEVVIEDDVWIGAKVTILKGVTVKSGNIVAAGAVVTKTIQENNVIIAGCPAFVIKKR